MAGENDAAIVAMAKKGIIECIRITDMRDLLSYGRTSKSDEALVSGTSTYTLPSATMAIDSVQLVDSNSKVYRLLEYIPWREFNLLEERQAKTGVPTHFTLKNGFDDENYIVYPVPDTDAAAEYTIRLNYFARITEPSADSDVIDMPREYSVPLCHYAEWYVQNKLGDPRADRSRRNYEISYSDFRNLKNRQPDKRRGFKVLIDRRRRPVFSRRLWTRW